MKGQHRKLPTAYSPSEYFQLALGAKTRTALALLVLLTTGVVAMGWFLKNEQLVQIWHWFAPMQLNTALCLGLLSASALLRQRETPAKWNIILAAAATLIAVLSGMEFVVGKDLGIDRLLIEPFITTNPDTPGRMSPTSALTLILISAASVVLTLKRHEQPMLLSATLNAFAALVAGSTLIAYLNGLENAPSWQGFTNTAPHTALCLIIVALIGFLDATDRLRQVGPHFLLWQNTLTYGFGVALSLILWFAASSADRRNLIDTLARSARVRATVLQANVDNSVEALRSVERFFAGSEMVSEKEFETFTRHYFDGKRAIVAIDWSPRVTDDTRRAVEAELEAAHGTAFRALEEPNHLVADGRADTYFPIIYSFPTDVAAAIYGFDRYSEPHRREWMDQAARTGLPTSWQLIRLLRLPPNGTVEDDLLIFVPVYTAGEAEAPEGIQSAADHRVRGFVVGVFRFSLLASRAFRGFPEGSPRVQIFRETDSQFVEPLVEYPPRGEAQETHPIESSLHRIAVVESLEFAGNRYFLRFTPTRQFYERFASHLPVVVLALSLLTTFVAATLLNLNSQRRAQIEESNERFRSSFENASHGMALVDMDGSWLNVNAPLCAITGFSKDELLHRNLREITHPDELAEDMRAVEQLLSLERSSFQRETRYLRNDGSVVPVRVNASMVRNEYNKPLYMIAQIQDISAQRDAEQKLLKATRDAQAAAEAKSEFLANMSHEIRTPLTAILGFSEELLDPTLQDPDRIDLTDTVLRNSQHLLDIVNDILDFSKIEAGKLSVHKERANIFELVDFIERALRDRAQAKGIGFSVDYLFPIPRTIETDTLRIKQILLNLVGNAIKFTERGHVRLSVSYRQERSQFVFSISDTGIGITEAQRAALFNVFSQADSSTTKRFGGTGLGLVISQRLAALLDGVIEVESTFQRGSTFSLILAIPPVSPHELSSSFEAPPRNALSIARRHEQFVGKVLVVEDGPDNQKLIRRLLRKCGLTVEIAENGKLAVRRAMSGGFDLVLMDMQMPELDGYAATSQLIDSGYHTPIIACTADASAENLHRLSTIGCKDVLLKPFIANELFAVVARHLPHAEAPKGAKLTDAELLELRQGYVRLLAGRLSELRDAEARGDLGDISAHAHRISGAGMFGFAELSAVAHDLQAAAKSGDASKSAELLSQLYAICESLLAEVQ